MSKINILGIVANIKSQSNVFTPIVEAIVNSIQSIIEKGEQSGIIKIIVKREHILDLDALPAIIGFDIIDNGEGFTEKNRDSFDTYYSEYKRTIGGKGFGRFMFLKYFGDVDVKSNFQEKGEYYSRTFSFGKKYQIIENERIEPSDLKKSETTVQLKNIKNVNFFDKGIDVFAKKLFEKILIFFINEKIKCPIIHLIDEYDNRTIILNDFLTINNEIKLLNSLNFELSSSISREVTEKFSIKIFKIYFSGNQRSKISLTAHSREVLETSLHNYVPEFEDDFFDEFEATNGISKRRNYIIKSYVLGDYLDKSVVTEREEFSFDKDKADSIYPFSKKDIESKVAELTKETLFEEVRSRADKKIEIVNDYVNNDAPWHKPYIKSLDLSRISYTTDIEKIESELQTIKFNAEQSATRELRALLDNVNNEEEERDRIGELISKITEIGKSDLVHYVCSRKFVLQTLKGLLKRRSDGKGFLEKDVHNLIYPMGKDSNVVEYHEHNLWLLDERLVFSEYIASDRKISSKKKDNALGEPDLLIFNKIRTYRNGTNEYSNPLTIFEFKRPKREDYGEDENPIIQIGEYLDEIRLGKYEMPEGFEKIKVNDNTPIYAYVVCEITDKIRLFAKQQQLIISPDQEGYFGFHSGYRMYIEIISFQKMLKDAELRNKIFFKKLKLE
jgi:hypothetical protein